MNKRWWIVGLCVALAVAILSPLASPHPDGLERVAEDQGFVERARDPMFEIIPDYVMPGIQREGMATVLAGVIGTLVMFGATFGLGRLLRHGRAEET